MNYAVLNHESLGYGRDVVLPDVSFSFTSGERIAILGRSGSGKTTLLNAIYRRLQHASRKPALVPQDHALVPQLSVFHNVYMGSLGRRSTACNIFNLLAPSKRQRRAVDVVLRQVGLEHLARTKVDQLSGGEKQRVALARAIFCGGDVLLGDEPVSSVDETQAVNLLDQLKSSFATSIVALHDVTLAQNFATRIIGIKNRQISMNVCPQALVAAELEHLYGPG